jgi:dUTP pyrophosphatase
MLGQPLRVLRNRHEATMPTKAHKGDLCYDFYAAEEVVIRPGQTRVVDLGVNLHIPEGYALILKERSGHASKGLRS